MRFRPLLLLLAACGELAQPPSPEPASVAAVPRRQPDLVVADDGRVSYVVTLREAALAEAPVSAKRDTRFPEHHDLRASGLVQWIEADHDVRATAMASHVTLAFSAFLTEAQAAELAADPRVASVTADEWVEFSAAVWTDLPGPELVSWGTRAVGGGGTDTKLRARVYILDGGISPHPDLNVVQSVNALDPTNQIPGCYPHANHVAGIVGGMVNGTGSRGVAPGVALVSVSVLDPATAQNGCLAGTDPTPKYPGFNYVAGLDWIHDDVQSRGVVGVVNISSNADYFSSDVVRSAFRRVATPVGTYRGALVVQSAGNQLENACGYAYGPAAANDGILVVGAINDHGHAVQRVNGINGFHNGAIAQSQPGSNYGACVEMWAPGAGIYSAWGNGGYVFLSGTSMAAPHVAGLAALLAAPGQTSVQLEAAVRARLDALGTADHDGLPIFMPTLAPLAPGVPRNTPYAEIHVGYDLPPVLTAPVNNDLVMYSDGASPTVFLDTLGTGSYGCNLRRRLLPGGAWQNLGAAPPQRIVSGLSWAVGTWEIASSTCPSAHASVLVRPAPVGYFTLDGVRLAEDATTTLPRTTTAVLGFASENATRCVVSAYRWNTGPFWPGWTPIPGFPRTYTTTPVVVGLVLTPDRYLYQSDCYDATETRRTRGTEIVITEAALAPTAGAWWNPQRSGNGFDLRPLGDTIYFSWFTYTVDGTPVWYQADLAREATQWRGALRRHTWVNNTPAYTIIGQVTLSFTSPTTGTFGWQIGAQSGSEPIERLIFGADLSVESFGGLWYDPYESGWGLAIDTQGTTHFAVLQVYQASGAPTWVYGVGPGGGTQVQIDLLRTTGTNLCPGCTGTPSVSVVNAGTMVSDLTRLWQGRAMTTIDTQVAGGSWYRANVDLYRIIGP